MAKLSPVLVLAPALLLSACGVSAPEARIVPPPLSKAGRAYAALLPWVDKALAAGPGYGLTELKWMDEANHLDRQGEDTSALYDEELKRHFRRQRSRILADLGAELALKPDAMLDDILVMSELPPDDARPLLHNDGMANWSVYSTMALTAAHRRASCAAIASTPRAWARQYPGRAPFDYGRFRISRDWLRYPVCPGQKRRPPPPYP